MAWWVFLLIGWILYVIINNIIEKSKQKRKRKELNNYISISNAWQLNKSQPIAIPQPLDKKSEDWALQIKKLLYDSVYYQNRNVYEFDKVLAELARVNKDILQEGGNSLVNHIVDRVEYLCGKEKAAFTELTDIMRNTGLENAALDIVINNRRKEKIKQDNRDTKQYNIHNPDVLLAKQIEEILRSAMYLEKKLGANTSFRSAAQNLFSLHETILKDGGEERLNSVLDFLDTDMKLYYDYLIFEFANEY